MCSSTSFVIQIANLYIEIGGYNDEDSACLRDLKRMFAHHEVSDDMVAVHRIVVCGFSQFEITSEAVLRWVSPCLGVAGSMPRFRWRFFCRNKEMPKYSGTCDVQCYKDELCQMDYFVPENGEWRIIHNAKKHVTYVYSDGHGEMSDDLPSMLVNVIGSQYGCYLLFAASVAINGQALLFVGDSGVGKTTLCLDLIKQGATYLGDDLVLVYLKEKQAMLGSLFFPVKCYSDRTHTRKKTFDVVAQLLPPLNVPIKTIFLLQRTYSPKDQSYVKPMQGETMFEMMLKMTNKANTHADGHHFVDTISSICSSVSCHYLFYGDRSKTNISYIVDND